MPKKIKVHEKALAHLSRGLYRSPASALRELVSNAWDANATWVRIDSDAPRFAQLTVQDNGEGFTKTAFEKMMAGGIGNSEKRPSKEELNFGRPVIGRLGIGMLGIAQICGSFTITSRTKDGKGFRARINLYDLIKERLDADDDSVTRSDNESSFGREVDVGEYEIDNTFDVAAHAVGTTIATTDVHPAFVQSFRETFKAIPRDWRKAVKDLGGTATLQESGDYWRLAWELAASCPIPYFTGNAIPQKLVEKDHIVLEGFHFALFLDGIELRKPLLLSRNPGGYTCQPIGNVESSVFGKKLKYHGYLLVQEGKQLYPDELRGIMIRIKQVGIGLYDASLLDYRYNEGPRSRWITGEILVDLGLEDALNIDRDSFNRFHPEFRALQKHIHTLLQTQVFPAVYRNIDKRSTARKHERTQHQKKVFRAVIQEQHEGKATVRAAGKESSALLVEKGTVSGRGSRISVNVPDPDSLPTKKAYRPLASALLALFDISMKETTFEKQRTAFMNGMLALLSRW